MITPIRLASIFQFIFVTPKVLLSLSCYILEELFEERQDDSIIPSEMAFKEWYETPNNSFGPGKRNV